MTSMMSVKTMVMMKKVIKRPTWPVPVDLLFERVRSRPYFALATTMVIFTFGWELWSSTRTELGTALGSASGPNLVSPLFLLLYQDCAGKTPGDGSTHWLGGTCDRVPFNSPLEILISMPIFISSLMMVQMVNNPYRSKLWCLPAFYTIFRYMLAFFLATLGVRVNCSTEQKFLGAESHCGREYLDDDEDHLPRAEIFERLLVFVLFLCWAATGGFLVRLLVQKPWMEIMEGRWEEHTKQLLIGAEPTGRPAAYQQIADSLREVCSPEDLPTCTLAALQAQEKAAEQRKQEQKRKEAEEAAAVAEAKAKETGYFASWLAWARTRSGTEEPASKRADDLPGLAYIGIVLSVLLVALLWIKVQVIVENIPNRVKTGTDALRNLADAMPLSASDGGSITLTGLLGDYSDVLANTSRETWRPRLGRNLAGLDVDSEAFDPTQGGHKEEHLRSFRADVAESRKRILEAQRLLRLIASDLDVRTAGGNTASDVRRVELLLASAPILGSEWSEQQPRPSGEASSGSQRRASAEDTETNTVTMSTNTFTSATTTRTSTTATTTRTETTPNQTERVPDATCLDSAPQNATDSNGYDCDSYHYVDYVPGLSYQICANSQYYDDSDFTADDMCCVCQRAAQIRQTAQRYRDSTRDWANAIDFVAGTFGPASLVASLIAMFPTLSVIRRTWRGWQRKRLELANGQARNSPQWVNTEAFDPVRAPYLPGLVASSVIMCFVTSWVTIFMVIDFFWIAVHFSSPERRAELGDWLVDQLVASLPVLLGFLIKYVLFDPVATCFLTDRGFVVRWCEFAWFIVVTLPWYTLVSGLAALYRLLTIYIVTWAYVVRVDLTMLPPEAQDWDPGYVASMAMLLMAHRHQNPVMETFAQSFINRQPDSSRVDSNGRVSSMKAKKDWRLAVTLVRNPQLTLCRRKQGRRFESLPNEGENARPQASETEKETGVASGVSSAARADVFEWKVPMPDGSTNTRLDTNVGQQDGVRPDEAPAQADTGVATHGAVASENVAALGVGPIFARSPSWSASGQDRTRTPERPLTTPACQKHDE
jgi:hypothetical protein